MESVVGFSDKLHRSSIIFEEELRNDRFVLFAADSPGLPIVVPERVRALLRQFDGNKPVYQVLEQSGSTSEALSTVAFLLDTGHLRFEPSPLPYTLPPTAETRAPTSVELWLHLTNKCNLQCSYCFVADKRPIVVTDEVIKSTANALGKTARTYQLKKVTVKFAGGEPTLALAQAEAFRSELTAQLSDGQTRLSFALLTNGTVLTRRVLDFLRGPDTTLTISIDGYGPVHNTFRVFRRTRLGSWDIIQENLACLGDNGIKPFIAATISCETCHSLPELLRWINAQGLRSRLNVVRQAERSWARTPETDNAYGRVCGQLIGAFGRAFEELEGPEYSFEFVSQLRICDLHFDQPVMASCGIGHNHIVVRPDGRVVSCPMAIGEAGVEPGDDLLEACRRSFPYRPDKRPPDSECLGCRWFPVCASGCPITNLRLNGDPFSKSPFCELYQFLIPSYIRLLAHKLIQVEQHGGNHGNPN